MWILGDDGVIGFYVMAAPALKGLMDEFRLVVGDEEAVASMYRYGKRCGSSLVESLGMKCSSMAEVLEVLPMLLAESGLGIGKAAVQGNSIVVTITESLETKVMHSSDIEGCHFTSGYLAGIVSSAYGNKCESQQDSCDIPGSCVFSVMVGCDCSTEEEEACSSCSDEVKPLPLEEGTIYLLKEKKPQKSYELLARWVGCGGKSLCVTREYPDKIRKNYPVGETQMLWLSSIEGGGSVDPTKLSSIFFETQMFMQENHSSMVLLSGLEFLSTHNGFLSVMKLVHLLSEQASVSGSVILIPVNPGAFDGIDLINLERETTPLPEDL